MGSRALSAKSADRLKDEIYRQMLRLEDGHSAAVPLALALLNAWSVCDSKPMNCDLRRWLRVVSPVCERMISEASQTDRERIVPVTQDGC